MPRSRKSSMLQGIPFLVLLGLLAGAIGGFGIGMVETKLSSSTATSSTK